MSSINNTVISWRSSSINFPSPRLAPRCQFPGCLAQASASDLSAACRWCWLMRRTCFPCWVLDQHLGGSVAWHPATKRNQDEPIKKKGHQNRGDEPPYWTGRGPILGRKVLALFFSKFWAFCMRFYPLIWSTWMRLRLDFNGSRKRTGTQMSPQWSRESPLSKQFVKESSR